MLMQKHNSQILITMHPTTKIYHNIYKCTDVTTQNRADDQQGQPSMGARPVSYKPQILEHTTQNVNYYLKRSMKIFIV